MKDTPSHLGGHQGITHTDQGALEFMRDDLNCKSMIDVGCGPGGQVRLARELKIDAVGVDGDVNCKPDVLHDFTKGVCTGDVIFRHFDFVWSVEFLEHVEAKFLPNIISLMTVVTPQYLVISAAPPQKRGHHHVNCQPSTYWIELFANFGFELDQALTMRLRGASTMKREFIRARGLVFSRK